MRALSKLQYLKDEFGVNLTFATLAMIMKYPFNSIEGNRGGINDGNLELSKKKFGFFYSEKDVYDKIKSELFFKKDIHLLFYWKLQMILHTQLQILKMVAKKGLLMKIILLKF